MTLTVLELAMALLYGQNIADGTTYDDGETSVVCVDDKGKRSVYWWDEEEGENHLIATYSPETKEIILYNEEKRDEEFDDAIHNITNATGEDLSVREGVKH